MPSDDYAQLTDVDLAAVVAYVRSLPAAPGTPLEYRLPLPVKLLYALGGIRDAAEKIDHRRPPPVPVPEGPTPAHGAYVATLCQGCHGERFSGGGIPGAPADWPPAANLTPGEGTALVRYDSVDKFKAMMRSGKRPDAAK